jgi:hypothetical protein
MSNSVEDGTIVELGGNKIVASKPGTVFLTAFKKPQHRRHLVVTRSWLADFTSQPSAECRALRAKLAVNKARLLGWIVATWVNKRNKFRRQMREFRLNPRKCYL